MTTPEEARKEADLIAGRYAMHATAKRLRDLAAQVEALQADAERWREFRNGKPLTVKCNKATVIFGPNREADYPQSLDAAVDAARKDQP